MDWNFNTGTGTIIFTNNYKDINKLGVWSAEPIPPPLPPLSTGVP
jgi:hypothetical protein